MALSFCKWLAARTTTAAAAAKRRHCHSDTLSPKENESASWKKVVHLLDEQKNIEIFLIGTNHYSSVDSDRVGKLIETVRPDVLALELCDWRAKHLSKRSEGIQELVSRHKLNSLSANFLRGAVLLPDKSELFNWDSVLQKAQQCGSQVSYIDMDVNEIIEQLKKSFSEEDMVSMASRLGEVVVRYPLLSHALVADAKLREELYKTEDFYRTYMEVIDLCFPKVAKALLHDRNDYMARKLEELKGRIVAVVGANHVDGMVTRCAHFLHKSERVDII